MVPMAELMARCPRPDRIEAILLRHARWVGAERVEEADLLERGLDGDHASGGRRALTLIQGEHLPVISALAGRKASAERLQRNVVVSGLNLFALRGARLRIGPEPIVEITGLRAPCSRLEEALGEGGYNAARGHGGWCTTVVHPGRIAAGQAIAQLAPQD